MALSLEFKRVSDDSKSNPRFSLVSGGSPFPAGTVFNITGYDFVERYVNGVLDSKSGKYPVFVTDIPKGDSFEVLFVSTITRTKRDYQLNEVRSEGTFSDYVRQVIADAKNSKEDKDRTDQAILQKIVDGCKDKPIIVSRRPYWGIAADGSQVARSIVDFNFVDKK